MVKNSMSTLITVITGDGIGPEITESVLAILKAADCPLEFQFCDCGEKVLSLGEGPLPKSALDIIKRNTIFIA